jgi:hypoxanthine phosphoribosyltransferase
VSQADLISLISLGIGVLGGISSVYFGIEARTIAKKVRNFNWADIEAGIKFLSSRTMRDFQPDLILCSSGGSAGIIANLFLTYTDKFIPLYIGVSKKRDAEFTSKPAFNAFYETSRWITFLPEAIFDDVNKKILILDDVVLTGETLHKMVELLLSNGFKRRNIRTATLFATEIAITSNRAPDIYWFKLSDSGFYFPWGKSTGKGY